MRYRHPQTRTLTKVLIGIQARSTSKRLPNKAAAMIGNKPMIEHVIGTVTEAVDFMSRNMPDPPEFYAALLIPSGDPLKKYAGQIAIVEGDEHDVLSRYHQAFLHYRPDYLVRVTGDCPLLPDFVISKHVRSALYSSTDYLTYGHPRFRTSPDGFDVEVLSKRMCRWLFENAKKPHDREHVTTLLVSSPPEWAKFGHVIDHIDRSSVKLSVDTVEDLERVRAEYDKITKIIEDAKSYRPNSLVFRL